MDIQDVLREIREAESHNEWNPRVPSEVLLPAAKIKRWRETIEAAMREPVAEVVHENGLPYGGIRMTKAFNPGTKFYTFPPDAAGEIQRLKALLETGREIVEQYAPGFELWLEEVDAALAGKEVSHEPE